MASWQYAWLTDQPYTTIGFSHPQSGLAAELAGILGVGVFMPQSTEWSVSLDRSRVNLGYVSGLLGDRGWEMFSVETRLQPGAMTPAQLQTNWYFKRQGPDKPASASVTTAPAMTAAPATPTYDTPLVAAAAPAASSWTPTVDAAPAAPVAIETAAAPAASSWTPSVDAAPAAAVAIDAAPAASSWIPTTDAAAAATPETAAAPSWQSSPVAPDTSSASTSTPAWAPTTPADTSYASPAAPSAPAAAAPAGPDQAPMTGESTPPAGPQA